MESPRILVLGAGVAGLSTAVALLERGCRVRVWTREEPGSTTSAVAAAIWHCFEAGTDPRIPRWALVSLRHFRSLAREPLSPVRLRTGRELLRRAEPRPFWAGEVPAFAERTGPGDPFVAVREATLPVVDMPRYLGELKRRLLEGGGRIETRELHHLDEALATGARVVNCTGMGARELCDDRELVPIRGQLVHVEAPGVTTYTWDDGDEGVPSYVIPRADEVVLGGTLERGRESLIPEEATTREILRRCTRLVPELRGARLRGARVGLRPFRPRVRLERDRESRGVLVHNYGHGGAGVTLSWGCAQEAADRVLE